MELITLPSEDIQNICQQMDDKALNRFVRTNGRIYQICNKVITQRRLKYEYNQRVELLYPWISEVFDGIYKEGHKTFFNLPYIDIPIRKTDIDKLVNCTIKIVE